MPGRAVQYRRYGTARDVLEVARDLPVPEVGPDELLVRVCASSVNPIDCAVRGGYGRAFFEARGLSRWPMCPGRDVSGEVIAIGPYGPATSHSWQVGDLIIAATLGGANADYARVPQNWAALKPASLSFIEAASIPYSALTAWSALVDAAGLNPAQAAGRRVIVTRAAGGVGGLAVQMLKAWGAYVAATCSTRNVEFVRALGADRVIDYSKESVKGLLHDFDLAFDASFDLEEALLDALKVQGDARYVSIVTPKLRLIDALGLEEGLRAGDELLAERVAAQRLLGRSYHWAFMRPNGEALKVIAALVDAGRLRPIVDRTFVLEEIVAAHEHCESGRSRGRIVIDLGGGS